MKFKKKIRRLVPKQNTKVSLFLVGAQKSGTSALNNYLIKHSEVAGGYTKEINFFNHEEKFLKGIKWYHNQYERPRFFKPKKIYLDSTPQYLFNLSVSQKIYNYNPKAKIVILLREPVSRAFSAWNMYRHFSKLKKIEKEELLKEHICNNEQEKFKNLINYNPFPSFDGIIEKELDDYKLLDFYPNIIKRGVYVDQVMPYLDLFGLENVLVFESEFFKNNKLEVTNIILEEMGLDPLKNKTFDLKPVHSRRYDSGINGSTKEKLKEFYKPYNDKLFRLINQKFDW